MARVRSYGGSAPRPRASSTPRNNHGITRDTYREISTAVANAINYKRRGDDEKSVQHGNRVVHLLQYHGML